MFETTSKLKND